MQTFMEKGAQDHKLETFLCVMKIRQASQYLDKMLMYLEVCIAFMWLPKLLPVRDAKYLINWCRCQICTIIRFQEKDVENVLMSSGGFQISIDKMSKSALPITQDSHIFLYDHSSMTKAQIWSFCGYDNRVDKLILNKVSAPLILSDYHTLKLIRLVNA